jgi:WD40 repeat protein
LYPLKIAVTPAGTRPPFVGDKEYAPAAWVRGFAGHTDVITGIQPLADGKRFLSSSNDKTVRLWDVTTEKEVRRWDFPAPVVELAKSKDDRVVLCKVHLPNADRKLPPVHDEAIAYDIAGNSAMSEQIANLALVLNQQQAASPGELSFQQHLPLQR